MLKTNLVNLFKTHQKKILDTASMFSIMMV